MKNFVRKGQKLPLYGVGPYIIAGMAAVAITGIILFSYVLKIGILEGPWVVVFRVVGIVLIVLGIFIWITGAVRSDMDRNIAENRLKTDGIYAWVRNPMYSGWWLAISGVVMLWHNVCLLLTILGGSSSSISSSSSKYTSGSFISSIFSSTGSFNRSSRTSIKRTSESCALSHSP